MEPKAPKPLRWLNIFTNCFTAIFLAATLYLELIVKLDSLTLKIVEFGALLIIFITGLVLRRVRNKDSWVSIVFSAIVFIAGVWMIGSLQITKYKNNVCLNKFGTEFNPVRQKLGIPILPAGWHIKYRFNRSTDWLKKDSSVFGHFGKSSMVDSLCSLRLEEDAYNLKPIRGVQRIIEIRAWFKKGTSTIQYVFTDGDSTRTISRQQADSIFAAEKIEKDY